MMPDVGHALSLDHDCYVFFWILLNYFTMYLIKLLMH